MSVGNQLNYYDPQWNALGSWILPGITDAWQLALDATGSNYINREKNRVIKLNQRVFTPMPILSDSTQSYVNPSPSRGNRATVSYLMKDDGQVTIAVYNEKAEKVLEARDFKAAGVQRTPLDLGGFPAGVYYYQVTVQAVSGGMVRTRLQKFVHIR